MTNTREERVALRPCAFCGLEPDANSLNAWCTGPDNKPHPLVNMRHEDWNTRVEPFPDVWEAIETCPDMRTVIFWADTSDGEMRNWRMATGYINKVAERIIWEGRDVRAWEHPPTHWAKLPDPPKVTVEEDRA